MLYVVLLVLLGLSIVGLLAALVAGIVYAVRKKWRATLLCLGLFLLCILTTGGSAVGLVIKAGADTISYISSLPPSPPSPPSPRLQAHIDAIKALTPTVDFSKVDNEYWTYDGCYDWWRVPVRYPFEVHSIDTLDWGALCKNMKDGKSADANIDCAQIVGDLTHYAVDAKMLAYRTADRDGRWVRFGLVFFDDRRRDQSFTTEKEMWDAATEAGWGGKHELPTVKQQYEGYWRF